MMIATETEQSAAATMVQAANEQLSDLQAAINSLDQRMSEAHEEQAAIAVAREDRAQRSSIACAEVERLKEAEHQATAYAKLAHKTPNQQRAIKAASDAKKAMQTAQGKLSILERETTEADQVADARELELDKQLDLHQSEKETREAEMAAVTRGLSQAKQELGQEKYTALVEAYQEKQRAMNLVATELVDLQVELHDFYEAAIQDLKDWPALAKQIAGLRPVDDSTSRMIEATIAYIEALVRDADQIRLDVGGLPWHMVDVLHVREGELRGRPGALEQRKHRLQQMLDAYRPIALTEQYGGE